MYFRNRFDAAQQLAPLLEKYRNEKGVILAVPRGGVPIGHYLAKYFGFPLELLLTKKLGHPLQPEFAIGAVTLEDSFVDEGFDLPPDFIEKEITRIRKELQRRYKSFMGDRKPIDLKGKTVIVVDDGIATGRTIMAAIKLLRKKQPKWLVVAVPVAPPSAASEFEGLVDDFICVYTPEDFFGVGGFYEDFEQVEDSEVMALLRELNGRKMAA
ncbi:MAG: phosphoribosyltransferase [Saprospiraceae bacterium]|nr:phosphoribosyltransferase [Saprospiraceae bacterium]